MKSHFGLIRKMFVVVTAGLALFSTAPVPASAASSYVVNTSATSCLGPGSAYTSIQAAIDDAPAAGVKKILICPGSYAGMLTIAGVNGLTLTAAQPDSTFDWPTITPPPASDGGAVISVSGGSKGIILEKFTIDGTNFASASSSMIGVSIGSSSATVQYVTIWKMRTNPVASSPLGIGVFAGDIDGNSTASAVTLKRVNIVDYQTNGLLVWGKVKLNVLESSINGENGTGTFRQEAILLEGLSVGTPSGTIAKNVIQGSTTTAIRIRETSKMNVTGNVINKGIYISTACIFAGAAASNNKISGNTILDVATTGAVGIEASISGPTVCDPKANGNSILNNIMVIKNRPGTYMSNLVADNPDGTYTPQLKATKITGNRIYGFCCTVFLINSAGPVTQSNNTVIK